MDIIQIVRQCRKCGYPKPPGRCRECARRYREAHRSEATRATKLWREQNKKQFDQYNRTYVRNRYKPHPRQYPNEEQQRERRRQTDREWNARNPEHRKTIRQAYRARRKQAQGTVAHAEWQWLCDYYGNRCLCCGGGGPLTMDHVIPLSKGGAHSIDNIQPLCSTCNSKKYDKHIDYRPILMVK